MSINSITIMQRRNLGDYQHREVSFSASLEENEDFDSVMADLNLKMFKALGFKTNSKVKPEVKEEMPPEEMPPEEMPPEEIPTQKKKKKSTKKTKKAKDPVEPEVIPTLEDVASACKSKANELGTAEKVKELISLCCGDSALKDADPSTFKDLLTKLKDA